MFQGVPLISVIMDGGWLKRSHKHSYNAKSGVAVIIKEFAVPWNKEQVMFQQQRTTTPKPHVLQKLEWLVMCHGNQHSSFWIQCCREHAWVKIHEGCR